MLKQYGLACFGYDSILGLPRMKRKAAMEFDTSAPQWPESEPRWPEPPEPEPPKRRQRPTWWAAVASAAAMLTVLAILAAFGLVHIGHTTPPKPVAAAPSSTSTTVPPASQNSSRIRLPDKLAGLARIPHTPSSLDPLMDQAEQQLEASGLAPASAAYGGTEQDPLLTLNVMAFPPGNDSGQQIADGLGSLGLQAFNHDGVTFHCSSAVTTKSSQSEPSACIFYDPHARMLVTLTSNAISWGDAQRLSDLAAQVRHFLDQI